MIFSMAKNSKIQNFDVKFLKIILPAYKEKVRILFYLSFLREYFITF
jgi:hypothetical protein